MTLNCFFLLVSPPKDVISYVTHLKTVVQKTIGHDYESFYSKAHLSLFQYYDFHNESKLYKYEEVISHIKSFEICIRNFNAFRNSGTIYLDIENAHDICALAEYLGYEINPHITIAKNLSPKDFDVVWQEFSQLSYNHRFTCNHVTVLKRSSDRWVDHLNLNLRNN
jgi:2'-5' RNA ligase